MKCDLFEGTSKDDFENDEEYTVVKMEELIMKNDMEYKETMRKILNKTVHILKFIYEKSIDVYNEPRLNVDAQQSGIDDADAVLEITELLEPPRKKE